MKSNKFAVVTNKSSKAINSLVYFHFSYDKLHVICSICNQINSFVDYFTKGSSTKFDKQCGRKWLLQFNSSCYRNEMTKTENVIAQNQNKTYPNTMYAWESLYCLCLFEIVWDGKV